MLLRDLVDVSLAIGQTPARTEKIARLAALLRAAGAEAPLAVAYLSGQLPQGRVGLSRRVLERALSTPVGAGPAPTLAMLDALFDEVASLRGGGSETRREQALARVLTAATPAERAFVARLVQGELRQGALEGVMQEALARATDIPPADVRRAAMLGGGVAAIAAVLFAEGRAGLARFALQPLSPVQPMLAQTGEDIGAACADFGLAAYEYKLDGVRLQAHKLGDEVRLFTRSLKDVTAAAPEICAALRALPARSLILDGEAIALKSNGRPQDFQVTMQRFARKPRSTDAIAQLPLSAYLFDCLFIDGEPLIDRATDARFAALSAVAPPALLVPRLVTAMADEAERFARTALEQGHEGVMVKRLDASYEAGRRGDAWRKIKPAHTLDLVVLAAEWGSGRRRGFLSNLHLGARDEATGAFVMLGKTFKGMTDAMLAWQTERLEAMALGTDGNVVHVRPELVVEVAFNDLQDSPHYPGGFALRFARVKRYRPDKRADEADTMASVKRLHRQARSALVQRVRARTAPPRAVAQTPADRGESV